jgi:hypothetical protein
MFDAPGSRNYRAINEKQLGGFRAEGDVIAV